MRRLLPVAAPKARLLLAACAATLGALAAPTHFDLVAEFSPPAKAGADAAVLVQFSPRDPDVRINELPAPRLALDPTQVVLEDRQAPAKTTPFDPEKVKAIDLAVPVRFPVALKATAPKGAHDVDALVTYFYCSKREGWCRKGKTEVSFRVTVR